MHDILIKNGTLIDGTGNPMYAADIAINDGLITEIGDLGGEKAEMVIDAYDHYVTPGFIDISNRSDVYWRLLHDPKLESLIHQGISTIICGNSGASLAPLYNEQMFHSTQKWTDVKGLNVSWQTMAQYLDTLEKRKLSLNFATFVGHGTLRRGLIGDDIRALTSDEIKTMEHYIATSIDEGALGVSLGLLYTHERDTSREELLSIAQIVHSKDALLVVHLRDEERDLISALDEILDIVEQTDVRTHITHLKAVGQSNWPLMKEALARIDTMIASGASISFDVYPYTVTGSVLYTFLPSWVSEGGKKMLLGRLSNENTRKQVYKELRQSKVQLDTAIVSQAPHAQDLRGKTLRQVAKEREIDVPTLIIDLLIASEGRVIILFDSLSEENVTRALESPYSVVTSNSPGYTISPETKDLRAHPRSFGAFPRLFARYVKERKVLSWESAVHKCTQKVAQRVGLRDRGILTEGFVADIAVIDPRIIRDVATMEKPIVYAQGVQSLIVNGEICVMQGYTTPHFRGKIIRHND